MGSKDRFYLGRVEERFGEFTSIDSFVFRVPAGEDVEIVAKRLAEEWRGIVEPDEEGNYWFDGNMHTPIDYSEIPKGDFIVLAKYLSNLTWLRDGQ